MKQQFYQVLFYAFVLNMISICPNALIGNTTSLVPINFNLNASSFSVLSATKDLPLDLECMVNQAVSVPGGTDGIASVEIKDGVAPYQVSLTGPKLENLQSLNGLVNFSDLLAGDYVVKIQDANNLLDSCSFTITEPIICDFFVTIAATPVSCFNANDGTASLGFTDGTGPFDITWSDPNYNGFSTVANLAPNDYGVTITDVNGCSDTIGIAIMEPDQLTPEIIASSSFLCEGEPIILSVDEDKYAAYDWSNSSQNNLTSINEGGTYRLTVTDSDGCQGVDTIAVDQIKQDTFREILLTCSPDNLGDFFIERKGSNGCNYVIFRTLELAKIDTILIKNTTCDPKKTGVFRTSIVNQFGCNNLKIEVVELLNSDTTYLNGVTCFTQDTGWTSITLTNQIGCDSIVKTKTVLDQSSECVIGYTVFVDTICSNQSEGSITLLSTFGEPPFNYFLFDTTNNGIDTINQGIITSLNEEITLENIPQGIYLIELFQESTNSRLARPVEIVQNSAIEVQARLSDFDGFAISCKDATDGRIRLDINGGKAPYTYLWESGEVTKDIENLTKGTYQVTVSDAQNCTTAETFNLYANEPLVNFTSEQPQCSGDDLGQLIISELINAKGDLAYSIDGILYNPIDQFPFMIDQLAIGEHQLFIQHSNDCLFDTTFIIPEADQLNLSVEQEQSVVLGDSLFINPGANFKITGMEWSSNPKLSCLDCSTLTVRPTKGGKYFLTAYDDAGCSTSTTINIQLETRKQVFIPNIFSPNNDGINDTYQIFMGNSVAKLNSLRIFDANGQLVYHANNLPVSTEGIGWNGEFNGQKMPAGVFIVLIEIALIDGTNRSYTEPLNLIY